MTSGRSVVLAVQRAAHLSVQRLQTDLVDLDLGPSEINVLANLSDGVGRTVSQLGAAAGTKPTTLTSVLDRLERRGLLTRLARAEDRRSVLVELTPAGVESAAEVMRAVARLDRRLLAGVPRTTADAVRTTLDSLGRDPR
ncbi:MarR family winged helix-turn-helix transcriptional regulator [Jatrophihabitans endophyticus]|uniref:MarR family winged helix-turn-helix transcriptional regulator n=1 Tax=Jatrophihabitans endophyticus TaxID=1206085 RepID=UPI001F1C12E4|nr:MarR family transcriptional regulator [Jatrophihabitans endophyticus]